MPTLHLRGNSFYLLYEHGEAGPFATLADVEAWLDWVELVQREST